MRYLIEVKRQKEEETIQKWGMENKIEIIESYDPVIKLTSDVEKIGLALRRFKKTGIDYDILVYYLRGKGVSRTTIDGVMGNLEEFFRKIGILPEDEN